MYVSYGYMHSRRQVHDQYPTTPISVVASTPVNDHRYGHPPLFPLSLFKTNRGPTCE